MPDAEREDLELTRHEQKERDTQTEAIERVRRAIHEAHATSRDKLKIAESIAQSDIRLRARKYLGDAEMLESREKLYLIKDDLNKGKSRLAELDLEASKGDTSRHRAQLERRRSVRQVLPRRLDEELLLRGDLQLHEPLPLFLSFRRSWSGEEVARELDDSRSR